MQFNMIIFIFVLINIHVILNNKNYGRRLISLRLESNLSTLMGKFRYSIQDVHEKTGLSRNTISSLYNNKATRIDYATIEKLCMLFDCGIEHLFTFENHSDIYSSMMKGDL
ncbi:MAG: helix-turn-helix domain-containing protein [Anaerofustis sp.]